MKIIVAGAGHGGLVAAKILAAKGHDVTIYEQCSQEELGHNWRDNIEQSVFSEFKIPVPNGVRKGTDPVVFAPFSENPIFLKIPDKVKDWYCDRQPILFHLIAEAEKAGAQVRYRTKVRKLLVEGDRINGVIIARKKVRADLVIDSCGIHSPLRKSLPPRFDITIEPKPADYISVYRGVFGYYHERLPENNQLNRIYLRFTGQPGVCRCLCDEDDLTVSVLIGKMGRMSRYDQETMFRQLRIENQVIGYEIKREEKFTAIPVRYPLTKMVTDGYAAVGDSAFMAGPMTARGVSNAIKAGKLLGERIVETNSYSAKNLWEYQVRYFREISGQAFFEDSMKRAILRIDLNDLKFILEKEIISPAELEKIISGAPLSLNFGNILNKVKKCKGHYNLIVEFAKIIINGKKAQKIANSIPRKYDKEKVGRWQKKISDCFK